MHILEQSTSITIQLGPFLDEDDGKTAETGLTIAQADIRLSKNGGNIAQSNDSSGATHDELGWYALTLDTTDTNTLGRLLVIVHESGALPVWREFMIVTANVWDTLCSTDKLQVHVAEMTADIVDASALKADAAAEIADAVWDELSTGHVSAGKAGTQLWTDLDAVLVDTAVIGALGAGLTDLGGMSTGMKGEVNAEADTALSDYDPPTKTEMDTAHGLLATEAKQDTIDGIVDNILVDTAVIGALGAGLTDLGGMSTGMKAEVQAEAEDALVAKHLDHLLAADYDPASKPGVATALLNELVEDDSGVSRFTENALEEAPGGGAGAGDATEAKQDTIITHLTDVKGTSFVKDTDSLVDLTHTAAGAGAITFTYTVTSTVGSTPIADVTVWVTTDAAGATIVASGTTDASGEVVFYLDADTYYIWSQKAGYDFTNPDTEVVA